MVIGIICRLDGEGLLAWVLLTVTMQVDCESGQYLLFTLFNRCAVE